MLFWLKSEIKSLFSSSPGEHRLIGPSLLVAPLVEADVVVVVVVNQVVDKFRLRFFVVAVIDPPALIDEERRGVVLGVHAERLAKEEEGIVLFGDVNHPARGRLIAQHAGRAVMRLPSDVGVLPELVVDIVLGVHLKARPIADLKAETEDLGRGRQAVVEDDPVLIGIVLDITLGPHHVQKLGLGTQRFVVGLDIRGDINPVVVVE